MSNVEVDSIDNVTVIRLVDNQLIGHLTVHQLSEELARIVGERSNQNVVLNMASVEILSSMMLGKLIAFNRDVRGRGGRLVLTNVAVEVQGVFAVANVDRLFAVMENETDAIGSM